MISFVSIRNNSLAYYYTLQFDTILFTNRASYRMYTQKESRQRQTLCYYNYRKSYAITFCISIKATKCILTQCMTRSLLPLATFKKSILHYKSTYVQQFLYYESHSSYPNTVQKDCTVVVYCTKVRQRDVGMGKGGMKFLKFHGGVASEILLVMRNEEPRDRRSVQPNKNPNSVGCRDDLRRIRDREETFSR